MKISTVYGRDSGSSRRDRLCIPQEEIEGHQTTSRHRHGAAHQALREEGGDEILALTDARGVIRPRRFVYSVNLYGRDMDLAEEISLEATSAMVHAGA